MEKDNQQYRYQLEHCRGDRRKLICPNCGHRTFVPYIDVETGEMLADGIGRCDRECNCGYHKTPKQFFEGNGRIHGKEYWFPNRSLNAAHHQTAFSTMDISVVEESQRNLVHNNFLIYLRENYPMMSVVEVINRYRIGTSNHWPGATVFWQIDSSNRVRTGKIMLYDYHTGHRVKDPESKICWAHCLPPFHDFKLRQTLFGAHLLTPGTKRVMVVEAEKTAVIASMFFPDEIWLATGGLGNIRRETCDILKGIQVILFPDLGAEDKWRAKADSIPELKGYRLSTWLQHNSTPWQREHGCDLADEMENWFPNVRPNIEGFL